ncbi:MAG TPA: flavin reductase family protein [Gammaproteobacteria bacterium]
MSADSPTSGKQNTKLAEQMRLAMRRMAATVSVISSIDEQDRIQAMTATSVVSLSLEPPALLACVNQWAAVHEPLTAGRAFCVNILSRNQQVIAQQCSRGRKYRDHLSADRWQSGPGGIPYLQDAQANLFCHCDKSICYATHTIFIGRVEHVQVHGDVNPLIYLNGKYL